MFVTMVESRLVFCVQPSRVRCVHVMSKCSRFYQVRIAIEPTIRKPVCHSMVNSNNDLVLVWIFRRALLGIVLQFSLSLG